jgi:uncharacterized membrane protein
VAATGAAAADVDRDRRASRPQAAAHLGPCPICGDAEVVERRCKVICLNCKTILQSCADL